jgi:hypothetical protein
MTRGEALAVLAERASADSGRAVSEVADLLGRVCAAPDAVEAADIIDLVEVLTPTMGRVCGPAMLAAARELAIYPPCVRAEIMAPVLSAVLPALVAVVLAEQGAAGA